MAPRKPSVLHLVILVIMALVTFTVANPIIATSSAISANSIWSPSTTTTHSLHPFFTGSISTPSTVKSSDTPAKTDTHTYGSYTYSSSSLTIAKHLLSPTPATTSTWTDEKSVSSPPTTLITQLLHDVSSPCVTAVFKTSPFKLGPTSTSYAATTTHTIEVNCGGCSLAVLSPFGFAPTATYTTTVNVPATQTVDEEVCSSSSVSPVASSFLSTASLYRKREEEHCG